MNVVALVLHTERKTMNIVVQVVAKLQERGLEAAYEYPGYIAIGDRSYGTANGDWGWDETRDGECVRSGELGIPGTSSDVQAIAEAIVANEVACA